MTNVKPPEGTAGGPPGHGESAGAKRLSPQAQGIENSARQTIGSLTDYEDYSKQREARRLFRLRALIGILILVAAGIFVSVFALRQAALNDKQGAADLTPDDAAVPAAPAVAPPAPAPQDAADAAGGGCWVPAASLNVTNVETLRDTGVADARMFVVQWDTQITNGTKTPILVEARFASTDAARPPGWETSGASVQPKQAYAWSMNFVTNNAGGTAGATTYFYPDRVIGVLDTPECRDLLSSPIPDSAMTAVPLPTLPANAEVPAG